MVQKNFDIKQLQNRMLKVLREFFLEMKNTKDFRVLKKIDRSVKIVRDLVFIKYDSKLNNKFEEDEYQILELPQENEQIPEPQLEEINNDEQNENNEPEIANPESENENENDEEFYSGNDERVDSEIEQQNEQRQSDRIRKKPDWMNDYEMGMVGVVANGEPKTNAEAIKRSHKEKWQEAVEAELDVLKRNNTWTEVNIEEATNIIDSKWCFKIKNSDSGNIKYKARLVARGFQQKNDFDIKEVYTPVAKMSTEFTGISNECNRSVFI